MSYQVTWADAKINKNEVSKLNEDGLDVFKDLPELIKHPFSEVDKGYYMYFKFAGLTVQKPQADGNFMMRIKIPGGVINLKQADHIAWIAETYGHGYVDLTTRQAVQYHWIPFAKLPELFKGINAVGLTTAGAEGDITRNIIDNPLSGIDPDELFDTRELVVQLNNHFQGNRDYSNLPRKMKISVSSSIYNAGNAEINDLSFVPALKTSNGKTVKGFNVLIGGGLGMRPFLGVTMNIFATPEQVLPIADAVVALYRDYGYRRNRSKARLKFLIQDWGVAKFEAKLREKLADLDLPTAGENQMIGWSAGAVLGIHPQKQAGYNYIGVSVPSGRIAAADFKAFIAIARQYGRDEIRFDHAQNLVIPYIADADLATVTALPIFEHYSYNPHKLLDFGTSCTGAQYCNLANAHTKELLKPLLNNLDDRFSFDQPIQITLNGCGNNCTHRSTADIGVEGARGKTAAGDKVDAYKLSVGGSLLNGGHFAEDLTGKVDKAHLADAIAALLADYRDHKTDAESFYAYYQRQGTAYFQTVFDQYLQQLQPAELLH